MNKELNQLALVALDIQRQLDNDAIRTAIFANAPMLYARIGTLSFLIEELAKGTPGARQLTDYLNELDVRLKERGNAAL